MTVYGLAEHCDCRENRTERSRGRRVIAILDANVSQKLQIKSDLSPETAVEIAQNAELVKTQNTIDTHSVGANAQNLDAASRHTDTREHRPQPQRSQLQQGSATHRRGDRGDAGGQGQRPHNTANRNNEYTDC